MRTVSKLDISEYDFCAVTTENFVCLRVLLFLPIFHRNSVCSFSGVLFSSPSINILMLIWHFKKKFPSLVNRCLLKDSTGRNTTESFN